MSVDNRGINKSNWGKIMSKDYYIRRGEKTVGPVTLEKIQVNLTSGKLVTSDLIATSPDGPWSVIKESSLIRTSNPKKANQAEEASQHSRSSNDSELVPPFDGNELDTDSTVKSLRWLGIALSWFGCVAYVLPLILLWPAWIPLLGFIVSAVGLGIYAHSKGRSLFWFLAAPLNIIAIYIVFRIKDLRAEEQSAKTDDLYRFRQLRELMSSSSDQQIASATNIFVSHLVDRGCYSDVDIQNGLEAIGIGAVMAQEAIAQTRELRIIKENERKRLNRKAGMRNMGFGCLWMLGGGIFTFAMYSSAKPGDNYIIASGAIVIGFAQFLKGLIDFIFAKDE